jgi:nitrogen fixation protein NifU and related proteins
MPRPETSAELSALYQELILDHYRRPRNKGTLENADASVEVKNPLCGDEIGLQVAFDAEGVRDLRFSGRGCSISQASASMLTEQIRGKKVDEIEGLVLNFRKMMAGEEGPGEEELGDLVALKGVVKYPVRIKCAVLAWDALQEGISQYEKAH